MNLTYINSLDRNTLGNAVHGGRYLHAASGPLAVT